MAGKITSAVVNTLESNIFNLKYMKIYETQGGQFTVVGGGGGASEATLSH